MTTMGKILVVVNFFFSLFVGALIIFVYVARTNWHHAHDQAKASVEKANSALQAYSTELVRVEKEAKDREDKLNVQLADMDKRYKAEVASKQKVEADLQAVKQQVGTSGAASQGSAEEVTRRDAEVKNLQKKIDELNGEKLALVKQSNDLRDKFMSADIAKNALMVRSEGLETQLQELAKQLAKVKATGSAGTLQASSNPPPEDVEGLVKSTDPSGLITLTIGSDAGLSPGNTLEIFRVSDDPTKSKYLGRIRIMDVRPNEAVAKPVSKPLGTIQKGDHVANRIKVG